jgi:hypothetical protein
MKARFFAKLLLVISVSGCAPWSLVGGPYVASSDRYEVELPQNWRKQNGRADSLALTRDGMTLQRIVIGRHPVDKDVPHIKRKLTNLMLPQDAAEVVIDHLRSDAARVDVRVLENVPAQVGGAEGFKIVYAYHTRANLRQMGAWYGVLHNNSFYYLHYEAPARHYFERDRAVFEKVRESFKFLD